jgi:hypothetical protein
VTQPHLAHAVELDSADTEVVARLSRSTDADTLRVIGLLAELIERCRVLHRKRQAFEKQTRELAAELSRKRRSSRALIGRPRYGSKPGQPKGVHRIQQLHEKGKSLRVIARALDDEGIRPALGLKWTAQSVSNVLKRSVEERLLRQPLPGFEE